MAPDTQTARPEVTDAELSGPLKALVADRVGIILMVLALYALLMHRYPIIYGGDPVARLVNFTKILNGHQLPLLQVLLAATLHRFYGPTAVFLLMALISAVACAGLYALTREITGDRRAAWLAAIFYTTHPFILYYSRVPYQEPLLLAGVYWGFYYLFRPASVASLMLSSLCFAAACLSRYEGWIAALTAAIYQIWRNNKNEGKIGISSVAWPLVAFGWAPAAWIASNRGLSPAGTYVLDIGFDWSRFYRPYFIAKSALWWTESAVILLALVGFTLSRPGARRHINQRSCVLLGFVVLFLSTLIFSGHGIEPDAARIVTEREAFVPIGVLVLYAGMGGSLLVDEVGRDRRRSSRLRLGIPMLALLLAAGYGLNKGIHRVAAANEDQVLKTDYQVGRFLAERQAGGLVLAVPLPAEEMRNYLDRVENWSGSQGRERAVQLLRESETTPLDYQRVLMYSWLGKNRVFAGEQLRGLDGPGIEKFLREKRIDYLIVFSDFRPVAEHERLVMANCGANGLPELVISNGDRLARIYSIHPQLVTKRA